MENPVFFVSEGPDLDMAGTQPTWTIPAWFTCRKQAAAHWEKVQRAAAITGRGIYPNEGVKIVPMKEAVEARFHWIADNYADWTEGLPE